jgi:diguanylate cyclase (GGDEF)-like protein/PAS domain S-box-containing protein
MRTPAGWFVRRPIKVRLAGGFTALAATTLAVGIAAVVALAHVSATYDRLLASRTARAQTALELQVAVARQAAAFRGYVLTREERYLEEWTGNRRAFARGLAALRLGADPATRRTLEEIERRYGLYVASVERARRALETRGEAAARRAILLEVTPANDATRAAIEPFVEHQRARMASGASDARGVARLAQVLAGAGVALAVGLAALLAATITRSITRPLRRLEEAAARMAGGDLDAVAGIRGRDEIARVGAAFDQMGAAVRRTLAEVRDREERHRAVVETAVDAIITIDAEGRIESFNPGAERMFGYRAEEAVGREVAMLMPEPDASRHQGFVRRYLSGGEARVIGIGREVLGRRRDGSTFPMHLSISEMTVGGRRMFTGIARDLTEVKRAEEELRRTLAERAIAREQAALRRVATAVAAEADPAEVFGLVADEIAALLEAEAGIVARFEGTRAIVVGASGSAAPSLGQRLSLEGDAALARVARSGAAARVDYASLPPADPLGRHAVALGFRQGAAAPVTVGGRLWGGVLAATTSPDGLDPSADRRLAHFAELLGLAIANADARSRLAEQAVTDALTGLANRRAFYRRLEEEVARARREGSSLALALLDLDNFKQINDRHGHQVGDEVLVAVAGRVAAQARSGDLVARVGGEEFAWILPGSDCAAALAAAERARRAVAAAGVAPLGTVTVSVGIADLAGAGDTEELVRQADAALYAAKSRGRNRCEVSPACSGPGSRPAAEPAAAVRGGGRLRSDGAPPGEPAAAARADPGGDRGSPRG